MIDTRSLVDVDPLLAGLVEKEVTRQRDGIQLIASENFDSVAMIQATRSGLTNKYSQGYAGRRY